MIYFKRLIFLLLISTSCQSPGQLTIEADITKDLKEVSAAELDLQSGLIWVIEDSGNKARLIGLNISGKPARTIKIKNAKNHDWEDLTSDKEGNIYIGDFGNNNGTRTDLKVYRIAITDYFASDSVTADVINFSYSTQTDFTPSPLATSPIMSPSLNSSRRLTVGLHGAPICCPRMISSSSGTGITSIFRSAVSFFDSGGCTPPFGNVNNVVIVQTLLKK